MFTLYVAGMSLLGAMYRLVKTQTAATQNAAGNASANAAATAAARRNCRLVRLNAPARPPLPRCPAPATTPGRL